MLRNFGYHALLKIAFEFASIALPYAAISLRTVTAAGLASKSPIWLHEAHDG
jgi:hypothetical protein